MNLKKSITWENPQELEDALFVCRDKKYSFSRFVQKAVKEKVQKELKNIQRRGLSEYHAYRLEEVPARAEIAHREDNQEVKSVEK